MNHSTSDNFTRKSSSHRLIGSTDVSNSIYIELDKEVEKLRKVLDDPLRVAQVSSVGFPLQVWERMFALDREQRAARAVQQQEQQQQQQQRQVDDDDDNGVDEDDENEEASEHVDRENKQGDEEKRSTSRRSPSRASSSAHSSGFASGLNLKRKAPVLRNCREHKMNAQFMHDLVRETVFGNNNSKVVVEDAAAENKKEKSIDEESVIPRKRNLFLLEEEGDGEEIIQRNQQIIEKIAKKEFQPKAVLHHIEVPSRILSVTPPSSPAGNINHNNNNSRVNISSSKEQKIDDPRKNKSSSSSSSTDQRNTTSNNANNNNIIAIADKPIRAFAPVYSLWGAIGGSTVAAAEQLKQQTRLQVMSRPIVERHDLPFEVTPANDFRQLAFPLVGLGHAVPYGDLLHEQQSLINMCNKK